MHDVNSLFEPGPVERGYYEFSGQTQQLAGDVLSSLLGYLDEEAHTHYLSEKPRNTKTNYHPNRTWRRNSQIGPIIWVDCDRSYDPGQAAFIAYERGLDPSRILKMIHVIRPLNADHLPQILDRIPKPALWAQKPEAVWWTPLVILSNPQSLTLGTGFQRDTYTVTLTDQRCPFGNRYWMLKQQLTDLGRRAIVLALTSAPLFFEGASGAEEGFLPTDCLTARSSK